MGCPDVDWMTGPLYFSRKVARKLRLPPRGRATPVIIATRYPRLDSTFVAAEWSDKTRAVARCAVLPDRRHGAVADSGRRR